MRNKKTIITATSLLAAALLFGMIMMPAVATPTLVQEAEKATDITAEVVEAPKEETETSERQGFVRPASPTDYEEEPDAVSTESSTIESAIDLISYEDYGNTGTTGTGGEIVIGDSQNELPIIPVDPSNDKIAIALDGHVDPGYQYEVEIDLSESQEFIIGDDIIEFEILEEGDDKYNIKSNIYLDYDKSCFTTTDKLHFTALGIDERNDLWDMLVLIKGAISAIIILAVIADIAMEVVITVVQAAIALPLILWFGFNEAQKWIEIIGDLIRDNWHNSLLREKIVDMVVEIIEAAAVKFVGTYSLLTEGNGSISFVPGLKGTLKQNCNPEDGYFDITITAISGVLSDSKVIRVFVTNPGSGGNTGVVAVGETNSQVQGQQSQGTNDL